MIAPPPPLEVAAPMPKTALNILKQFGSLYPQAYSQGSLPNPCISANRSIAMSIYNGIFVKCNRIDFSVSGPLHGPSSSDLFFS